MARVEHLLQRYGSPATEVLDLCAANSVLAEALLGVDDYLAAEVVYAVSHEGARHLDDVLTRRTRISIETWDRTPQRKEIEHYLARVDAERASQQQPDDETADSARMGAPEIVPLA